LVDSAEEKHSARSQGFFFGGVLKLGTMAAGKCAQVSLAVAMGVIAIVIALGGTVGLVGLIVRD